MGAQPEQATEREFFLLAEELRSIGELGAMLAAKTEDRVRFQRVLALAEVLATGKLRKPVEAPASVVDQWFHASPLLSADCVAFDESGRILLIQRNDNGLWALPGGLVDVGESPAIAAVREAQEEVGLQAEVLSLVGLYDSRLVGTDTPFQVIHLVYECVASGDSELRTSEEVDDFGWFSPGELPQISPGHEDRIRDAFLVRAGKLPRQPIC
ncbi:NUDIX hydrolase [Streptomyces sp. N50]|uniref:NUDIX hydrolase n=1 Tax=Streptomyces sp. N50 TaxID=3081765 RepID=UPI002962574F|nr:NUDIX domain-containing protein [Streptomyces sp. N50]WOX10290.1 NUDIX domain-containing protein [Streptomyces sp. N50]